jgi:DNA-binding response OmpR family regulator
MEGGKIVVLIIDDEPVVLSSLSAIMRQNSSYDVRIAKSGKAALQLLSNQTADIILLDISMPEMDGFEIMKHIRMIPGRKDIPIIFITSHTTKNMVVYARAQGARDYIVKPVNPELLLDKIQNLLCVSGEEDAVAELAVSPDVAECTEPGKASVWALLGRLHNACSEGQHDMAESIVVELKERQNQRLGIVLNKRIDEMEMLLQNFDYETIIKRIDALLIPLRMRGIS